MCDRGAKGRSHLRLDPVAHVFFRHAKPYSAQIAIEVYHVIGHAFPAAGRIALIRTGDNPQNQSGVAHRLRQRPNLVER